MRGLLDCDGVLADFTGKVLEVISEEFGREYSYDDITQWDFGNLLKDKDEERRLWAALTAPGIAAELSPIGEARECVDALKAAGHEVYIVTSPMPTCPTWAYERTLWLRDEMGIDRKHVVHTPTKHVVCGDVLVDDNIEHIAAWCEAWDREGGVGILIDAPYNQGTLPPNAARVADLPQALEHIELMVAHRSAAETARLLGPYVRA